MESTPATDSHALTITRVLPASREAVFDAWTMPESVRRWMCPEGGSVALAELDVRVGGTFRIDMAHDGDYTVHTGTYREVRPPEKLVFTWTSKHTQQHTTLVTVELRAIGNQTELTLTHRRFPDEEAVRLHTSGWAGILERLAHVIRPGPNMMGA